MSSLPHRLTLLAFSSSLSLAIGSSAYAQSAVAAVKASSHQDQTTAAAVKKKNESARVVRRTAKSAAAQPEVLTVTGSALSSGKNQDPNPVQIISSRDIQQTSAVTLGDYLQRLPSMGSQGANNTTTNGGLGMSCPDLRNLGPSRVLVLVDGKRQVETMGQGSSCVDLNSIPVDQIASVEILKDGGSELYGADAVSGVINIKLKHNLTTGSIQVRGGISSYGDGQSGKISGFKGFNFDHDRGNISIFGQYMTTSPIYQRDRQWSRLPWNANVAPGETVPYGSSVSTATRVMVPNADGSTTNLVSNNTGGGVNGFHTFGNSDRYNFARDASMTNYLQSGNLSGDMHYDINKHFQLYSSVRYTHKDAMNEMAPNPLTGASYPSTLSTSWILPAGNPYNSWGEDVSMYKRMADLGNREYKEGVDTYQVMGGMKGQIVGNWQYDLSMTYGSSVATMTTDNMTNYRNAMNVLGTQQVDPSDANSAVIYNPSVCTSSPGCTLINPFAPLSQQAKDYIGYAQNDHSYYQMRDFNARVFNNKLVKLPYEHGGNIGIAGGVEHRSEQASYTPDALAANGDLGGGATYTGGGYNVTEVYLEGKIPLLQNAFLAKDLTIDAQGRYSHYNTFGSAENWKVGINWAPVQDIRFRATLGTSFRAPNMSELFGGQSISYNPGTDPCAQATSYGAASAAVTSKCLSQGVNPANFVNVNSGQIPTLTGGNPNLQPEIGRTYTVGTVITPRWVPGLMASVEYWHYTVQHMINTLPVQYVADQCYTGADPSYCSQVQQRSTAGQLTQVSDLYANVGGLRTNGIDFDLSYHIQVTPQDSFTLENNFQQLVGYLQQNEPNGQWNNYAGRLFYQSGYGMPRVRDYATITWHHNDFSLRYMMHYTGGMKFTDGSSDLSCKAYVYCKVPGIFSHDVTVSYRLNRWNFEGGVNNILDKKPPFVPDGATNTALAMYSDEIIGRYVFLQAGVQF
ncbi:TonB-dependent receptor domain-containing protein [Acetobacter persici]|uniref:TonB-dependent receptor domain-containing protein n=1 Tax=Acetobacter persici TaxID=1076596 RepID=UPI0039EC4F81